LFSPKSFFGESTFCSSFLLSKNWDETKMCWASNKSSNYKLHATFSAPGRRRACRRRKLFSSSKRCQGRPQTERSVSNTLQTASFESSRVFKFKQRVSALKGEQKSALSHSLSTEGKKKNYFRRWETTQEECTLTHTLGLPVMCIHTLICAASAKVTLSLSMRVDLRIQPSSFNFFRRRVSSGEFRELARLLPPLSQGKRIFLLRREGNGYLCTASITTSTAPATTRGSGNQQLTASTPIPASDSWWVRCKQKQKRNWELCSWKTEIVPNMNVWPNLSGLNNPSWVKIT